MTGSPPVRGVALLGPAVLIVAQIRRRCLQLSQELRVFSLGMGAAWLAEFDLSGASNRALRNNTIGTTVTGFLIAGATPFCREVLRFLAEISRKATDEAQVLEKEQHPRQVACRFRHGHGAATSTA